MWQDGVAVARICARFGLSTDGANRVRCRLRLVARTPASRAAPDPPHSDPTPEEIEAILVELRAKHMAKRLAEPPQRKYRTDTDLGGRVYTCDDLGLDG